MKLGVCQFCGYDANRKTEMSKPDDRAFVRVEFSRGTSIKNDAPRHPWHWIIMIQHGQPFYISDSFDSITEAARNFMDVGAKKSKRRNSVCQKCIVKTTRSLMTLI